MLLMLATFAAAAPSAGGAEALTLGPAPLGLYGFNAAGPVDSNGFSLNPVGDVDGDGHPDFAVGSAGNNSARGVVYVIFGGQSLTGLDLTARSWRGFEIRGGGVEQGFGLAVAGAGDINRDGHDDVLVGAPRASPEGRAGGVSLTSYTGRPRRGSWTLTGSEPAV